MKPLPPSFALKFLRWYCRPEHLDELEGDLVEIFRSEYDSSPSRARLHFIRQVITHFRPEFIRPFFNRQPRKPFFMSRHHLVIAFRGMMRYKSAFAINIAGLTTGFVCAMLITLWILDEMSVNQHNANNDRLYQVMQNTVAHGEINTGDGTPGILANALAHEIPDIEFATAVVPPSWFYQKGTAWFDGKALKASCQFADQNFSDIFSIHFIRGPRQPSAGKYHIAISDELAISMFGSIDEATGKSIDYRWEHFSHQYEVTSVFQSLPSNATERFDVLLNYEVFLDSKPWLREWGNSDPKTYVLLREGTNVGALNERLGNFIKTKFSDSHQTLFLQPYRDRYLFGRYENGVPAGGRIEYIRLFSAIAIFVILIACVNFMNLSTARASRRMKEVGVRKTLGASRRGLASQFMIESFALTSIGLMLSLVLVVLLLPAFNMLTTKAIIMPRDVGFYLALGAVATLTAFLSGSYPALYLSAFQPGDVLKGKLHYSFSEMFIRKGLVIFQYTTSTIMIVAVAVLYLQVDYVQSKNLGYNRDLVVQFEMERPASPDQNFFEAGGAFEKNMEGFLVELKNTPGVLSAANFVHDVTGDHGSLGGVDWEPGDEDSDIGFNNLEVGYDFLTTLKIAVKEGRAYSRDLANERQKIMLNETAVAMMGISNPIGTTIKVWGEDREIIGIVNDFNIESLYEPIKPTLIQLEPRGYRVMARLGPGDITGTLNAIQKQVATRNAGIPFEYNFLDDIYNSLYAAEQRIAVLSGWFAVVAVLISCLGLFGLTTFTVERRMKEMSIRKVFGASGRTIVSLLSTEFTRLVGISLFAGLPLGYIAAHYWLSNFAYRMELSWWIFAGAATVLVLITLTTTLRATWTAARANPLEALRND